MRLQGLAVWEILVFLVNATLFILIGLQLPVVVEGIEDLSRGPACRLLALVTAVVVACRFAWVFTVPYLIRLIDRRPGQRARRVGPRRASWSPGPACEGRSPSPPRWRSRSRPTRATRCPSGS